MNTLLAEPRLDCMTEQNGSADADVRMQIRGLLTALYPQADLAEDIRKSEIRVGARARREKDSQSHKKHGSENGMPPDAERGIPLLFPLAYRKGHRNANHEHEGRLNQIPETGTGPLHMT